MKGLAFKIIGVVAIVFSLQSCKEDIELLGNFEETAVVYGLLDQSEEVHMIKITRAFNGSGSNALDIAQIPDSNYFQTVNATIEEYVNNSLARTFTLQDTIVTDKDPNGAFYAPNQKMYYFTTTSSDPLLDNAEYRLTIDISHGSKSFTVKGSTRMVKMGNTTINSYKYLDNQNNLSSQTVSIAPGNASRINATLEINFKEWVGNDSTLRTIPWNLGDANTAGITGSKGFSSSGATFYDLIATNVNNDPSITKRTFHSITAKFTGASDDLVQYIDVNEPSSGLAQSQPTFTNLTASGSSNVVGVFTSRQTVSEETFLVDPINTFIRGLDKRTTQRLCIGPETGLLLFCSHHPNDNTEAWFCN